MALQNGVISRNSSHGIKRLASMDAVYEIRILGQGAEARVYACKVGNVISFFMLGDHSSGSINQARRYCAQFE